MTKRQNQTSLNNIFYFQEKPQVILDLMLTNSFEEIGFYTIFKSAYYLHKGKLPCDKLMQFCRVFDKQKEFKSWVENFAEKGGKFYKKKEFDEEIELIEEKSKNKKNAVNSRWSKGTNVTTNVGTNGVTKTLNTKTLNTKTLEQETLDTKTKYQDLSNGLKFILENKQNKKINITSWHEPIRKLIDIDLKDRINAIDDVKRAIQAIANHYGEDFFPEVQAGSSLRNKFTKIENFLARNKGTKTNSITNLWEKYKDE